MSHLVVDSPLGPITLVSGDEGPAADHLTGVYMGDHRHAPDASWFGPLVTADDEDAPAVLVAAAEQLAAFFAGTRRTFDLPTAATGTPFQEAVWAALTRIPYGETWSYTRLAAEIGRPTAMRAVGLANGRNPLSIVVPCHRVVGADGAPRGYAGGAERKLVLLAHERGVLAAVPEPAAG
ncbi:methylated-DNA--[protein]-cysteine S-methyltransferase [Cellulomonas marina]|uniref:Methylated-DNA--protein-cysteine methyltransferase n=1 Tax=Cellulomonas marina TaxID=988821 RepID=A0A1I0ZAX8_9CELL|nr:methylated-DNA--[protein]-cysteine S-methyltransferase [Cellulomonas marina]GIG30836.1 methylated-DNA--protein-cysteine methyltransferase [Cellulomonas marina]SFB21393.1 methylated-DNA-[protein]-cysteine S-methyltransferase [Cellulomonas marina]